MQKQTGSVDSENQAELQHQHALHWQAMQQAASNQPSMLGSMSTTNCSPDLYQHLQRLQLTPFTSSSGTNFAGQAVSIVASGSGGFLPPIGGVVHVIASDVAHQRISPPPSSMAGGGGLHIIKEDSGDAGDNMDFEHMPSLGHGSVKNAAPLITTTGCSNKYFVNPQISITDAQGHVTPVAEIIKEDNAQLGGESSMSISARPSVPDPVIVVSSDFQDCSSSSSGGGLSNYQPPFGQLHNVFAPLEPVTSQQRYMSCGMEAPLANPYALSGIAGDVNNPLCYAYSSLTNGYYAVVGSTTAAPTVNVNGGERQRLLSADSMDSLDILSYLHPELQQDISTVSFQSQRTMSDLLRQIRQTLEERRVPDVSYEQPKMASSEGGDGDGAIFVLQNANVSMELQVCPGIAQRALRVKKLAGDIHQYYQLCSQVLSCVEW